MKNLMIVTVALTIAAGVSLDATSADAKHTKKKQTQEVKVTGCKKNRFYFNPENLPTDHCGRPIGNPKIPITGCKNIPYLNPDKLPTGRCGIPIGHAQAKKDKAQPIGSAQGPVLITQDD